ncbi:MAG: hypothetical protein ABSH45_16580 [Bryobacteraceae bacterium]|jgi:hypothetical protein
MPTESVCPLDGIPAVIADYAMTDSIQVRCPECGTFRIRRAALPLLEENPELKPGLARWVRCYFDKYGEPFQITEERLGFPEDC